MLVGFSIPSNLYITYLRAFSRIFFFKSSGFCTASPDFSPPAKKSCSSVSSPSDESPAPPPPPEAKSPSVANFFLGAALRADDEDEAAAEDEAGTALPPRVLPPAGAPELPSVPSCRSPPVVVSCKASSCSAKNSVTAASMSHPLAARYS